MKTPCKHCSSSGIYITYVGYPSIMSTGITQTYDTIPCKYCDGLGYIDEDKFITVPRKYVKDEYFENRY